MRSLIRDWKIVPLICNDTQVPFHGQLDQSPQIRCGKIRFAEIVRVAQQDGPVLAVTAPHMASASSCQPSSRSGTNTGMPSASNTRSIREVSLEEGSIISSPRPTTQSPPSPLLLQKLHQVSLGNTNRPELFRFCRHYTLEYANGGQNRVPNGDHWIKYKHTISKSVAHQSRCATHLSSIRAPLGSPWTSTTARAGLCSPKVSRYIPLNTAKRLMSVRNTSTATTSCSA